MKTLPMFFVLFCCFTIESAAGFLLAVKKTVCSTSLAHSIPTNPSRLLSKSICKSHEHPPHLDEHEEKIVVGNRWHPLTVQEKILLPLKLVGSIYILILLPAGIAQQRLCGASCMRSLPYEYLGFFGALVLPRQYRYGRFAKSEKFKRKTNGKPTSIFFLVSMIGAHWSAAFRYARSFSQTGIPHDGIYYWLLRGLRLAATVLVAISGWHLGCSYDRVTVPHSLVQTGPYRWIRHPIYTAYFLFFAGCLLEMNGFFEYAVWFVAAVLFYCDRMAVEEKILYKTFGETYGRYQERVPWRLIPRLY